MIGQCHKELQESAVIRLMLLEDSRKYYEGPNVFLEPTQITCF